jgi:hypothetical protein
MKKLTFFTFVLVSCLSINNPKKGLSIENCYILGIKEYQYAFRLIALKENDTILIVSLKDEYYTKHGYQKSRLNNLEEIKVNKKYDFYLVKRKPVVSTMEQMGAFIIVENDTLWKSKTYKEIPASFTSYNTIGNLIKNN